MNTDQIKLRLEDAGRVLMMLPMPQNGYPMGYQSHWPEIVRTAQEFFAAQVQADQDHREELLAGRNAVRIRPHQRQVDLAWEAIEWIYAFVDDPRLRKIAFARALKHPVSDRYLVSYRKLGRLFSMDHKAIRRWHDEALAAIYCGLSKKYCPETPKYAMCCATR